MARSRAEWQESRERAISSAEGMLAAISGVLLVLIVLFQKLKDWS